MALSQAVVDRVMHTFSYPEDLRVMSGLSPQALEAELVFLLAVKLFELRRLSLRVLAHAS